MVHTLDVTFPAADFVLDEVFRTVPTVTAEFAPVVPTSQSPIPFLAVSGDAEGLAGSVLADSRLLRRVETQFEERGVTGYQLWWERDRGLPSVLISTEAVVLEATGQDREWRLQMAFLADGDMSAFQAACDAHGVEMQVRRVSSGPPLDASPLTPEQREAIETARDCGYFEVPRETTVEDIADRLGISDQAASQRLRRGLRAQLDATL